MLNRLNINDGLSKYVFDVSVQETDCLRRLREETAAMPLAEMQIVPEEGQLLAFLVRLLGVRKALEIGVFTGYSSLWTAMALPADGSLVACDISKEWTDIAQRYWREAGIADRIDLRLGPALDTLNNLFMEGYGESFDFAFIDSDKENYPAYFDCCIQLVRPGGLIVLDNMLRSGEVIDPTITETGTVQIRRLNECIKRDQRIFSCLLPVADGVQLVMKRPREISPLGSAENRRVTVRHDADAVSPMSKRPGEPAEAAALPGPRSLPGLGYRQQGLRMLLDPISFFVRMQRRYGDICSWARNNEKFINLYAPRFNRLVLENSDLFLIDLS